MTDDQIFIPEDVRPFPHTKNPHCNTELWRPQEDLIDEDEMRDPNWYPKSTYTNIYNRENFERSEAGKVMRENSRV